MVQYVVSCSQHHTKCCNQKKRSAALQNNVTGFLYSSLLFSIIEAPTLWIMGSCFVRRCIWNCRTSIRPSSRFLHTADKQPAKPAVKEAPIEEGQPDTDGQFDDQSPPDGTGGDGPKYRPRRKPGISDFDDFIKIQEAWSQKLPLDEDPSIPDYVVKRPELTHIQSSLRKIFSNEFFVKLQKNYDFSLDAIRRLAERRQFLKNVKGQRFIPVRHGILGPDLATGHFVTRRGGRIKFVGHSEWFTQPEQMPNKYDEHFLIEKVDASGKLYLCIYSTHTRCVWESDLTSLS